MADEGSFEKGVVFYDARSEGAVGYNVKSLPIENAIKQFKKASTDFELDAGVYLMRSYYFKGKFIAKTDDEKKKVFSKGKKLGERLVELYPNSLLFDIGFWLTLEVGPKYMGPWQQLKKVLLDL